MKSEKMKNEKWGKGEKKKREKVLSLLLLLSLLMLSRTMRTKRTRNGQPGSVSWISDKVIRWKDYQFPILNRDSASLRVRFQLGRAPCPGCPSGRFLIYYVLKFMRLLRHLRFASVPRNDGVLYREGVCLAAAPPNIL